MKWYTVAFSLSLVALAGCKKDPVPTPEPQKEPLATPSAAPRASVSARTALPLPESNTPEEIPTLVAEPFTFQGGDPDGIYLMEDGTLAVKEKLKVGRVVDDDKIEWLKQELSETNQWLGGSTIYWVGGRWPDAVDVMYKSNNGRASQPTFEPLTGKGNRIVYGEGGGMGDILGVARLGESTLIGGMELFGAKFATVRGPGVIRARKAFGEGGCKKEEITVQPFGTEYDAVTLRALGATGAGTVISLGILCYGRNAALEVWEKDSKLSKIIDLGPELKDVEYYTAQILPGKGDDAWIRPGWRTILRYVEGRIEKMPEVPDGATRIFMSPNGKLYASNGRGIHRWDTEHWTQVARFNWEEGYPYFLADSKERFWRNAWSVRIMRPGKSIEMHDACTTPFVYLYDVSSENKPDFTFPSTRKALGSFPEVGDVNLVEFNQDKRRLGIVVKSKAQGEAVIAQIKTTMPKENPRLICYQPEKPRVIDMQAKSK